MQIADLNMQPLQGKIKRHLERVSIRKKKRENKYVQEGNSGKEDDDISDNNATKKNNFFIFLKTCITIIYGT